MRYDIWDMDSGIPYFYTPVFLAVWDLGFGIWDSSACSHNLSQQSVSQSAILQYSYDYHVKQSGGEQ
jgi:hypothetical protein